MFDNVSKFLIEQFSPDFASWLLGQEIMLSELSPSELSLEPIRADALLLLQAEAVVLHCEVQTDPDPTMGFRMADYALRVYRRFPQKQLVQVVLYLRPTESELVRQDTFSANNLRHTFQVVRLWEQPTAIFLERPGLLPYAVLSQTPDRVGVLQQVAAVIDTLPDRTQQANLAAATGILAGLRLDKQVVQRLLRRELMRESSIYQELQAEARAEAQAAIGAAVQEARIAEARSMVQRSLKRRVGAIPVDLQTRLEPLSLEQLETLGEALLDFTNLSDLVLWLDQVLAP